jgi:hypothetical protein
MSRTAHRAAAVKSTIKASTSTVPAGNRAARRRAARLAAKSAPAPTAAPAAVAKEAAAASAATPSAARVEANRANAQHSTGPRTPEGLARSSQNAVKHGMFSQPLGLAAKRLGESREQFDTLLAQLRQRYEPVDIDEGLLVDRLAAMWWRLGRLHLHGQAYLDRRLAEGAIPIFGLKESELFEVEEARLERSMTRLWRNLQFLQRWRLGAAERTQSARRAESERRGKEAEAEFWRGAAAIEAEAEALRQAYRGRGAAETGAQSEALPEAAPTPQAARAAAQAQPAAPRAHTAPVGPAPLLSALPGQPRKQGPGDAGAVRRPAAPAAGSGRARGTPARSTA